MKNPFEICLMKSSSNLSVTLHSPEDKVKALSQTHKVQRKWSAHFGMHSSTRLQQRHCSWGPSDPLSSFSLANSSSGLNLTGLSQRTLPQPSGKHSLHAGFPP